MKKKFILLPIIVLLSYVTFTSMSSGPGWDYSTPGSGGCSCHGSGAASPVITVNMQLLTNPGLAPVTAYVAGGSYYIRITGTNTGATSLPKFGYQVCALNSSSTSVGSLTPDGQGHNVTAGPVLLVEHSTPQNPISGSGGNGTVYQKDVQWSAPVAGTGNVTLRGVINAVNMLSGADINDRWNPGSATVQELAQIAGPSSVCISSTIALSDATAGGVWGSSTPAIATVSASGVVNGLTAGTTTISYSFGGSVVTKIVTVNANPGTFGGTPVVCMTGTTTVTNSVSGGTWTSGAPSVATVAAGTGVVTGVTAGNALLTYSIGSCSATATVTVNSLLPNTGTASVCAGSSTGLSNPNPGGTWSSSAPSVATVTTIGTVNGLIPGTTNISYTLASGCTSVTTVTVNAVPGSIGGPLAVCVSGTVAATNAVGGGTWSTTAGTGSINIDASTGVITGNTTGTANVTYTLAGGCFTTAIATVNPPPSVITGTNTFCANATTTLSSTPAGGTWTSSNTAIAVAAPATGVISGGGPAGGFALITYTLGTGCFRIANVNVNPISPVTGTLGVCQDATTTLGSAPAGGTWTSGATGVATVTATGGTVAGLAAGTAPITYTVSTGCRASAVVTVNARAAITGGGSVCTGAQLNLANPVSGGTWASSNTAVGTISATGVFNALTAGNSTIAYTTPEGCVSTTVVTVNTAPGAVTGAGGGTFCGSATITASGGAGGTIYFQGTTANGTSAAIPSTSQPVTASGTYYFRVQSAAGCWGPEAAVSVTVNPAPAPITGISSICIGSTAALASTPAGGTWSSSNTTVGTVNTATGAFEALSNGNTTIVYTTAAGCTTSGIITVNVAPGAVTGSGGGAFCTSATIGASGGTGGTIFFQGTVAGGTSPSAPSTSQVVTASGTYYFRVRSSAGCWGPEAAISVTINPVPAAISGTASVCAGASAILSSTPAGGTWSSSDPSKGTIDAGNGTFTGIAIGTTTITYTAAGCTTTRTATVGAAPAAVTVTGGGAFCTSASIAASGGTGGTIFFQGTTSGGTSTAAPFTTQSVTSSGTYYFRSRSATGCWGPEGSVTVTINAAPAAITGPAAVCAGATVNQNSGTPGGTWASSNTSAATIGASDGIISGITSGTTIITYTNTVTGCFVTRTFTVNPLPGTVGGTLSVCKLSSTTLSGSPAGGTWTSGNTSLATIGVTSGVMNGLDEGTLAITYTLSTGCYRIATATVNPLPDVITGGNIALCVDGNATLTNTTAAGTWSSSNTVVATVSAGGGLVTAEAAGTATISYMLPTGCRTTTSVTVNPLPSAISGMLAACIGQTTTLSSAPTNGTWTSSDPGNAAIGGSTGILSGIAEGTSVISYILPTGCARTATASVNPLPTGITGTAFTCAGLPTTLESTPAGGTWTSGATGIATVGATSGIVTGTAAGTANITYSVSSGCYTSTVVTVSPAPSAGTLSGSASVCTGLTIAMSSTVPGGIWASSDPAIASADMTSGIITGHTEGTATISYTVNSACGPVTATRNVTVTNSAVAGTIGGPAEVCTGSGITLTSSVLGGTWQTASAGIASISSTTGVLTGIAAGIATVTYTISSSCGVATATASIAVNPLPPAITGLATICVNASSTFSNSVAGGTWGSTNGGIAFAGESTGTVTGISAGMASIIYTLPTGCAASRTVNILALPAPIEGPLNMCAGNTAMLSNITTGGTWASSNTSVAAINPSTGFVTSFMPGTAIIHYTAGATGCVRSAALAVNANPAGITGTTSVCAGSTTTLANTTGGGTWSSSNTAIAGINEATGAVSGMSAGTAIVTYQLAATGCRRTAMVNVHALPAPIGGATSVCPGNAALATSATPGGTWSSSNEAAATIGTATGIMSGVAAGNTIITYTSGMGCRRTALIVVHPLPAAITGSLSLCQGASAALSSATAGGIWLSSNTTAATVSTSTGLVTAVAAGSSTITYMLPTGCAATAVTTTNALPGAIAGNTLVCNGATQAYASSTPGGTWSSSNAAVAAISAAGGIVTGSAVGAAVITYALPTGCARTMAISVTPAPAPITGITSLCEGAFTVLSSSGTGGSWSSGATGIASAAAGGVVSGISGGVANISYSFATGCRAIATVTVNALPAAITGAGNVCQGATTTLASGTPGGTWASSAATTASVSPATGIVTGIATGITSISYTLPTGCLRSVNIAVNPLPAAGAISGSATLCQGATATLAATAAGGFWSITTGKANVGITGVMTGLAPGADTIKYSVTNACGTAVARHAVTVAPLPVPGVISGNADICLGGAGTLSGSAPGGAWTSSNTGVATVSGLGIVLAVATGSATVSYTVTNSCGSASATKVITVHPLADAGIVTGPSHVCQDATIGLASMVTGGTWGSSNTAIATVSSTGMVTGIMPGTAAIKYTVFNVCSMDTATRTVTVKAATDCATYATDIAADGSIRFYPNPTSGMLTVQSPVRGTLMICTIDGREVYRTNTGTGATVMQLPAGLAAGVYMCRFADETGNNVMARLVYTP